MNMSNIWKMAPSGCSCFYRVSRKFCKHLSSEQEHSSISEIMDVMNASEGEKDEIVMDSSNMGEFIASPWHLIVTRDAVVSEVLWEDPLEKPSLTSKQKKYISKWIRLCEQKGVKNIFTSTPSSERIKQGYVANCSFLSSLAALSHYEDVYHIPLLTNIIKLVVVKGDAACEFGGNAYSRKELPLEENQKIAIGVKMYINGTARCILVDDWVPIRSDGRLICAHSTDPSECWVPLLEKAFVKINGGSYSIKGTNPGIDIYHLTGWIPDIIPLPSRASAKGWDGISVEQNASKWNAIWDTMYAGFSGGLCVVCIGTGEISDAAPYSLEHAEGVSESTGIVSDHAYSVLDIKDINMPNNKRARLLYIKNPWRKMSWRGRFSPYDDEVWTPEMQRILNYTPNKEKDSGLFWMEWSDVLNWFSHLYISWKPNVFRNRITLHHIWKPNPLFLASNTPEDVYLSLFNPQFRITVNLGEYNSATVWVMFLQHRKSNDKSLKYFALHVFSQLGPAICPAIPDVQGVYNNSECILAKLMVKRNFVTEKTANHMLTGDAVVGHEDNHNSSVLVIPSFYNKKITTDSPFTIRVLSNRPVNIVSKPCIVKDGWNLVTMEGKWDETNSGGSPNELWNYFMNPHYRLCFDEETEAIVLLESDKPISLNLRIFRGRLATFRALKQGNIMSSGEYKTHCCAIHRIFKAGQYVIIPSAFKPANRGDFRIVVHSMKPCWIKPLPYPYSKICRLPGLHSQKIEAAKPVYLKVDVPTLVSIRIEVPYGILSDMFVLYASTYHAPHKSPKEMFCHYVADDGYFCLSLYCMYCGGPTCRFRPLNYQDPKPGGTDEYDLILYCDLNGGLSKTGRIPSASSRSLFQKRRVISFTLVELLPSKKPYKLCAVGVATRGTCTFISTNQITIS